MDNSLIQTLLPKICEGIFKLLIHHKTIQLDNNDSLLFTLNNCTKIPFLANRYVSNNDNTISPNEGELSNENILYCNNDNQKTSSL